MVSSSSLYIQPASRHELLLSRVSPSTSSYSPLHITLCHEARSGLSSARTQQRRRRQSPAFSSITTTATELPSAKSCEPIWHRQAAIILNAWEELINTTIDPPSKQPYLDPKLVLSNNFAPVKELPPTECRITAGSLPSCLDGAYLRIGPNPQFLPRGPYHYFDGDGMIHCLRISGGGAHVTLSSRYVQTYKYTVENQAGTSIIPYTLSAGFNSLPALASRVILPIGRILAGQFNPFNGIGTANTALAHIGDSLYALCEADLPYKIRVTADGDIVTLGREDFNGKLINNMTAHPKFDPETGEVFAFRYSGISPFLTFPFLTFFRFDQKGNKLSDEFPILSMKNPILLHDFAITKKYIVFCETQIEIVLNPAELIFQGKHIIEHNADKVPRIGVIPRNAKDDREIKWIDAPGLNILHTINAWDEVDEDGNESIVLVAPNFLSLDQFLKRMDLTHGSVEMVRIQVQTGDVSRMQLSPMNLEFGVVNPSYAGRKNRFAYAAVADPMPKMVGVVKLDLDAKRESETFVIAKRMYEEGQFGGETFFVAKDPENKESKEDDGYLLSFIHDEKKGESMFIVMDAGSPHLEVVAQVVLPQRVPYGFHGLYVRENDLLEMSSV